jgi:hypothetical protein
MEFFSSFGIFFGGLGFLLIGCGLCWFVAEYSKRNKSK